MRPLPNSSFGRWGFYCTLAFLVLFAAKASGMLISAPSLIVFAVGTAGLILNVIAFIKKDRSFIGVVLGALVGSFIILWMAGELLFQH